MATNFESDDVAATERTSFAVGNHALVVDSAMELLANFEVLVESLVEMRPALVVIPIDEDEFMQVSALEDGGLRLESSSSNEVFAANLGFTDLVEGHSHIAGANIPADWIGLELMAAETLMRLAVDIHGVIFPAAIEFRVFPRPL